MSFPVVIQSQNEAEHRNDYANTDQRWQVGQKMVMADGRAYRFALVGGSTMVAGNIADGPAEITNHLQTAATVQAAGLGTVSATLGATVSAKNQYRGGYASVTLDPGGGYTYILNAGLNIDTHEANAGSAVLTATLAPGETLQEALTATSDVSWILNPYAGIIQSPATTLISQPAGVVVKDSTTGRWQWLQTRGIATVLVSGTAVVGNRAIRLPAGAAVAGPEAETSGVGAIIGTVVTVGSTWTVLDLMLDG